MASADEPTLPVDCATAATLFRADGRFVHCPSGVRPLAYRKLEETEGGASYHVHSVFVITSINQPVHITVPPHSQVASMPGR